MIVKDDQPARKTTNLANIAFGIVVLSAYFATFSAIKEISLLDLILFVVLGIVYFTVGIYGFAFASHADLPIIRLGYILLEVILGSLIVALSKGVGFSALILLPLAGHAVVLLTETWAYVANLLIVSGYVVAVGALNVEVTGVWPDLPIFLSGLIFIVVFTQVAVGEEQARREVERLNDKLLHANAQLREFANQVEELSVTRERNRLAREIHDGLGHYLTTIYMEIQAARAVMDNNPQKAMQMLEKAQNLSEDALVDVRASVSALRIRNDPQTPLSQEINGLLKHCDISGIRAHLIVKGMERTIDPVAHTSLYRTAQECINNSCKHSKASNLTVTLVYEDDDWIKLIIIDDGIGAEGISGGFGLIGLKERMALLRGEMAIDTTPGKGFRISVKVIG